MSYHSSVLMTGETVSLMSEINGCKMIALFSAFLALGTSFLFFPGLMSSDSIFMYKQVIGDIPINNYHPPIMVHAWQLGHRLFGPGSMLVFHQLMYWSAIAIIAICVHRRFWVRAPMVVFLGLLPPLWIHSVTIWNDTGVMSSLLLAVACTLLLERTGLRWILIVGVLALFYAQAVKQTAIFAAMPLFYILCDAYLNSGQRCSRWSRVAVLAIILSASSLLAALIFNFAGTEKFTKWPTVAVWDLAAVSIAEQKILVPTAILWIKDEPETSALARIEQAFDPEVNGPLGAAVNLFPAPENLRGLFKDWLGLPLHYPVSYSKHRMRVFTRVLGIGTDGNRLPFHFPIAPNDFGLQLLNQNNKVLDASIHWVTKSTNTLIYRPWFYLAVLVLILILAGYKQLRKNSFKTRFLICMGVSGLLYIAPLLILAPATDFRYVLWMVGSSVVMLFVVCAKHDSESFDSSLCARTAKNGDTQG